MKLLYVPGIGKRGRTWNWLTALNESLVGAGFPTLSDTQVIAPNYYPDLMTDGLKSKTPKQTDKQQCAASGHPVTFTEGAPRSSALRRRVGP